jgi:transposase-like protein
MKPFDLDQVTVEKMVDTEECPFCNSDSSYITYSDKERTDVGVSQKASCSGCGAKWTEYYSISAVTVTTLPENQQDDSDDPTSVEYEVEEIISPCPICGGFGVYVGTLGNLAHFRCRSCGIPFFIEA